MNAYHRGMLDMWGIFKSGCDGSARSLALLIVVLSLFTGLQVQAQPIPADQQRDVAEAVQPMSLDEMMRESAEGVVARNFPLDANLSLAAQRIYTWREGPTTHVLAELDVKMAVDTYGFAADSVYLQITPRDLPQGRAWALAIYFNELDALHGHGPVAQEASNLLVTAMIRGRVKLDTASLIRETQTQHPLAVAGAARIARHEQALEQNLVGRDFSQPLIPQQELALREQRRRQIQMDQFGRTDAGPGVPDRSQEVEDEPARFRAPAPTVIFSASKIIYRPIEQPDENAPDVEATDQTPGEAVVLLIDDVQLFYDLPDGRTMILTADNAVLFTGDQAMEPDAAGELSADSIQGVYLEDNVMITDGEYTLRGPRVFYDVRTERAVVLDAVFHTFDVESGLPLYVRADRLRQVSSSQWSASKAVLTTSEFGEPHFSIGVSDVLITQYPDSQGDTTTRARAKHLTFNVGKLPIFYWPYVEGRVGEPLLRQINMGYNDNRGVVIETRWDLFGLMGSSEPEGVRADLLVDGYTDRGAGLGVDIEYERANAYGNLLAYGMYDSGQAEPGGRTSVARDFNDLRGVFQLQHRHRLPGNWEATLELGYVSDEVFLEEFFTDMAYADKDVESLLYLKQQSDEDAFTALFKYDMIDFVPNLATLQTPGYTVNKFPEFAYFRPGSSLWRDRLTWTSENRLSVMQRNLPDVSPRDMIFNTPESLALFGIPNGTSFDTAFNAAGIDDDTHYRFDTRQEISAPLKIDAFDVTPFVVGRFTAYDEDFNQFAGNDQSLRLWGGAGVRMHTEFSRVYDTVDSRLLDIHRLRHIIEPTATVFYSGTNVEQSELPVFDHDIESISEGLATKMGVRQTLQTQRGGPGYWRSVDFLTLETGVVVHAGEGPRESPIARFFDYRPEFSLAGDHMYAELGWLITDTLSFAGNMNYDFEAEKIQQWNLGFALAHTPRMSTYVQVRSIEPLDTVLLTYGITYQISPKYTVALSQGFDLRDDTTRTVNISLTRRLPRWLFVLNVSFDELGDEQSVGIALVPEGANTGAIPVSQRESD